MDYVSYIRGMVGHKKIIMNAAAVIIVNNGAILLQRRSDNGQWGLIGGILELDETYREAAVREAAEETGLLVRLEYLVGIYHGYQVRWASGDCAHVICAVFKAGVTGEPRCDAESIELRYFMPDQLPEIHAEDHRRAIQDYLSGVRDRVD